MSYVIVHMNVLGSRSGSNGLSHDAAKMVAQTAVQLWAVDDSGSRTNDYLDSVRELMYKKSDSSEALGVSDLPAPW